jgi:hypothetical protein
MKKGKLPREVYKNVRFPFFSIIKILKYMCCSNCNLKLRLVDKVLKLCKDCKKETLDKSKNKKGKYTYIKRNSFYNYSKNNVSKNNRILKDEEFYEKCFNSCSLHMCEECGLKLNDKFRDNDGKIINRFRYSHIIPKSIASNLKYSLYNINHLCLKCHSNWENGDKKSMRIFPKNKKRFPQYL